jgi:hypothetical protein
VALAIAFFGLLMATGVIPRPQTRRTLETGGPGRRSSCSWRPASPWPRPEPPGDSSESTRPPLSRATPARHSEGLAISTRQGG